MLQITALALVKSPFNLFPLPSEEDTYALNAATEKGVLRVASAKMAHTRQSRPDYGLGFGEKSFQLVPSSLGHLHTKLKILNAEIENSKR